MVSARRFSGACGPAACTGRPCEQVDWHKVPPGTVRDAQADRDCTASSPPHASVLALSDSGEQLQRTLQPVVYFGGLCGRAHAVSDMQPDPEWFFCRYQVLVHGRGRGLAGAMGRGRLMPNKQNLRVVECKPQPCVVSVEGLSSSTTDAQLKSLLTSVGPIQVGHPARSVCALCLALPRLSSLKPLRRKLNVLPLCTLGTRTFCLRVRVFGVFQVLRNFMNCLFQLSKLSFEILKLSLNS